MSQIIVFAIYKLLECPTFSSAPEETECFLHRMIPNTYHVSSFSCSGIESCIVEIFSTFGVNLGLQKMFCGVRCVKDGSATSTDLDLAKIWRGRHSVVPIIGCRIVLSNHTWCDWFLGTPVIMLGICMLVISIVGLLGYDCNLTWLMLLVLLALFGLSLFAFIVTFEGAGKAVSGRECKEYMLGDYSEWLQDRVNSRWPQIRSCMVENNICGNLRNEGPTPALQFYKKDLCPLEGHRVHGGHKKTIIPNKRQMLPYFYELFCW